MKKALTYTYLALIFLTIIGFIIFPSFKTHSLIFSESSLVVSLLVSLLIIQAEIDPVFKITLIIGNALIAIVNYSLSLMMPTYIANNIILFISITLIVVELLAVAGLRFISKFA